MIGMKTLASVDLFKVPIDARMPTPSMPRIEGLLVARHSNLCRKFEYGDIRGFAVVICRFGEAWMKWH